LSSDSPAERAYAAGVEDLARHLLGKGTGRHLQQLLGDVERAVDARVHLAR
jgi:hypothetical protein